MDKKEKLFMFFSFVLVTLSLLFVVFVAAAPKDNLKSANSPDSYKDFPSPGKKVTCFDTDADTTYTTGKDYFQKGFLKWSNTSSTLTFTDSCLSSTHLTENYCSGIPSGDNLVQTVNCSVVGQKQFPGSKGWFCMDGACKHASDLVISSVEFETVINQSNGKEDINYSIIITNKGDLIAGASPTKVNAYFPAGLGVPNVENKHFVHPLQPGESFNIIGSYHTYNATWSACPGTHTLKVLVDFNKIVLESNEKNNLKVLTVSC